MVSINTPPPPGDPARGSKGGGGNGTAVFLPIQPTVKRYFLGAGFDAEPLAKALVKVELQYALAVSEAAVIAYKALIEHLD